MAVAPTGAIYKAMTIDGESSRNYGVYITGQAVYNAPQREVEMISIAGRNGKFALDKGRFENIEVTYPAGIYADTEEEFAEAVSNFRNYLCSRDGYVRIEDEYNPNEYRMGVYKSGLEVTPKLLKAGEFNITFDCKPQRWLKSGENAITVASGDVVTNPTLFESSPMLEVIGNGDIVMNGQEISITGRPLGEILLSSESSTQTVTLNVSNLEEGDSIYPKLSTIIGSANSTCAEIRFTSSTLMAFHFDSASGDVTVMFEGYHGKSVRAYMMFTNLGFVYGTPSTASGEAQLTEGHGGGTVYRFTLTAEYDGNDTITLTCTYTGGRGDITTSIRSYHHAPYYGNSTKVILPEPIYIDLDIGEAYGETGGQIVSVNDSVELPSDLPKLSSGANTITYSGDITDLKIIPRWWKV